MCIDFVDSFVHSPVESSMESFVCASSGVLWSFFLQFSLVQFLAVHCTEFCICNRPMTLTMSYLQWLKKKQPSSFCVPRPCSIRSRLMFHLSA